MIPTGDVVILREEELETDLATAIQRVRGDANTSRSRILIVGPDQDTTEAETASDGALPRPKMPVTATQLGRLRERLVLEEIGQRFHRLVDSLAMLEGEITSMAAGLVHDAAEAPRAHIQSGVQRIAEALDWTREVLDELFVESERLEHGMRACSSADLVDEAARQVETFFPRIRVRAGHDVVPPVVGRSADFVEAVFQALVVVAHRIGGCGAIHVSERVEDEFVAISLLGIGEPQVVEAQDLVARVREIVQAHGGRIRPTEHGVHGTGVEIVWPRA
ncbi:MAG: HAMP domain-containing histidine kinase [Planctomycetes bacterium]|nr:HAMP domain-containing histidine kinase [Planctomycetota bacterium]